MKFKVNELNIFFKNIEAPIYEKSKDQKESGDNNKEKEKVKKMNISENINKITTLLDRLNNNEDKDGKNLDIICNFLNQAIDGKGAKFMVVENSDGKKELGLVIDNKNDNSQENANKILNKIEKSLKFEGDNKDLFFDKNENNKKDIGELSIDKDGKINGVDIKDNEKTFYANLDKSFSGKYYTKGDKFIYEVGKEGDPGAAILRQVTALANELGINIKDYKEIKKKIENLYAYKDGKNVVFSKDKPEGTNAKQVKNLEITIKGKTIKGFDALNFMVHPGDQIDISSLSKSLKNNLAKVVNAKVETKDNKTKNWGKFYTSGGVEQWDLPDGKNISYKKTDGTIINTNGKNIQITAKNIFDTENNGDNKFSHSKKIGDNKYLVIGENPTGNKINIDSNKDIKSQLKNSGLEAWLASYDKNGNMIIEEVGDPKVHEFITMNNSVESGKSANNPIYLVEGKDGNNYIFQREIDGKEKDININKKALAQILLEKMGKNKSSFILEKKDLESIFGQEFKIDDLFAQFNGKNEKIFFEFSNLLKNSKSNILEDVIVSFEKTKEGKLSIKKESIHENIDLSNWGSNGFAFDKFDIKNFITQCEVVKSVNKNTIETKAIKNLGYPSFVVSKKADVLTFTKKGKDGYSFEVRGVKIEKENDLINFFNKDFVNVIFAASNPKFLQYDTNNKKAYIEYGSISKARKEIKDYIKTNINNNQTGDKFIENTIKSKIGKESSKK